MLALNTSRMDLPSDLTAYHCLHFGEQLFAVRTHVWVHTKKLCLNKEF